MSAEAYNYEHFGLEHRTLDRLDGPDVGQPAPDFAALPLGSGPSVKLSDFRGRTVVLETGSATCPVYVARIGPMNALAAKYPEVVFLLLYTREAHPGEKLGPHRSLEDKERAAGLVVAEDGERRRVLVDDLAGTAHRAYGAMPDTAYVIDATGSVVFRCQWNDPDLVGQALQALADDGPMPAAPQPGFRRGFAAREAVAAVQERVFGRAGQQARADFERALPFAAGGAGQPRGEDPGSGR